MTDGVLRLPFDQYQRYRLVADLLAGMRGDRPLRVLDVGGRTALLRRFLREDDVVLVDVEESDVRERIVLGDGSRLPFADASFDAVCAFDTLEHVPPPYRRAFVAECARVARSWCVIAGPYAAPRVEQAEKLLQRYLKDKLAFRHRYLEEHHEHGLPDRAAVEHQLAEGGAHVAAFPQGNLHRWLFLMCVSMTLDHDPALRELAGDLFAYYNAELYETDVDEPVYRHVVVASKPGARPIELGMRAAPDAGARAALRDPLLPTALMTAELVAFDRERATWRAERASFAETVAARDRELAEHRQVLAAREEELARWRDAVGRMDRDLRWLPVAALVKLRRLFGKA